MRNTSKKYNYCPICPLNVQLRKVEGRKYTYECPSCGLRVYPNRLMRNIVANRKINIVQIPIEVWAAEAEGSFQP